MSVCTGIELVESLPTGGDLLKVTIDNTTEALWFFEHSAALEYLNQDVIVEYRQDIYKGDLRQFIATFVKPTKVNTIDREENIKLFCDSVDNYSNVSFNEIQMGETRAGCIVYCISSEFKTSAAAVWQELIIRDRSMHVAKLRIFDYDNKSADYAGSYVCTELARNQYGFQSEFIAPINGECPPNPEIEIARNFIVSYFSDDVAAMDYNAKYALIDTLQTVIDYEPGYALVRLAMELSMVDAMKNITNDVDLKSIGQALLAERGFHCRKSELSSLVNNVIMASSAQWPNKVLVLKLLDIPTEENIPEYKVMCSIKSTVDSILRVRKGVVD